MKTFKISFSQSGKGLCTFAIHVTINAETQEGKIHTLDSNNAIYVRTCSLNSRPVSSPPISSFPQEQQVVTEFQEFSLQEYKQKVRHFWVNIGKKLQNIKIGTRKYHMARIYESLLRSPIDLWASWETLYRKWFTLIIKKNNPLPGVKLVQDIWCWKMCAWFQGTSQLKQSFKQLTSCN